MASARVQRWALTLSGFDYSVEYVKGSFNNADSLSRMPCKLSRERKQTFCRVWLHLMGLPKTDSTEVKTTNV